MSRRHCFILTPGRCNAAYFEHSYLPFYEDDMAYVPAHSAQDIEELFGRL